MRNLVTSATALVTILVAYLMLGAWVGQFWQALAWEAEVFLGVAGVVAGPIIAAALICRRKGRKRPSHDCPPA